MADKRDNSDRPDEAREMRVDGVLPPSDRAELAALLRDLEMVGAMRRAQLSSAAEERIFAASDLQLPLSTAEVRPVAGRIVPVRRSVVPSWMRIAAAIAVVGSLAAGAIVLSRGFPGADQGGAPAGRMIAEGDAAVGPASAPASIPATTIATAVSSPAASPEHFELALATDPLHRASSLPARTVAAALDSPKRLAYPSIARVDAVGLASAVATEGRDLDVAGLDVTGLDVTGLDEAGLGFDEAFDLDFDGLSGEFAAIVSRSASAF